MLLQVEEYADEIFDLLNNGAHMYFCGLKGMMPGILDMLERVSKEKGINFEEFVEGLKHKNQWHVEVRHGVWVFATTSSATWLLEKL